MRCCKIFTTRTFITVFSKLGKNWKQLECISVREWWYKLWYMLIKKHTVVKIDVFEFFNDMRHSHYGLLCEKNRNQRQWSQLCFFFLNYNILTIREKNAVYKRIKLWFMTCWLDDDILQFLDKIILFASCETSNDGK